MYVRGEAYLAAQRGAEAAAEFKKILDHRSLVTGAKTSYRNFLAFWKDADPEIPILRKARTEFASLR